MWARSNLPPRRSEALADVQVCIYVDGTAVHVTGPAQEVASTICRASAELIESLEQGLSMRDSRRDSLQSEGQGKTVPATTDRTVTRAVATSMRHWGTQVKSNASHLEVSFRPGGKTRSPPRSLPPGWRRWRIAASEPSDSDGDWVYTSRRQASYLWPPTVQR